MLMFNDLFGFISDFIPPSSLIWYFYMSIYESRAHTVHFFALFMTNVMFVIHWLRVTEPIAKKLNSIHKHSNKCAFIRTCVNGEKREQSAQQINDRLQ